MWKLANYGTRGKTRSEAMGSLGEQLDRANVASDAIIHVDVYEDGTDANYKFIASAMVRTPTATEE